uniref:Retrovirus-related Pol polyprotein from transposon TNT 1-94-like beta-barrel domain-containing protein n=1 Tax=Nymphaea colorata TaxID=210225 RepID=A0A5K0Z4E1_9MAGN
MPTLASREREREFHLTHLLTSLKKGDDSVDEYINNSKAVCDDLAAIGKPVDDGARVYWLLQGLGDGYEAFVAAMIRPPAPSYEEVVSLLQSFDTRLKAPMPPFMAMVNQHQPNHSHGREHGRGRGRNYNNNRRRNHNQFQTNDSHFSKSDDKKNKSVVVCQICRKKYHSAIKCFERFNHGYQAEDAQQDMTALSLDDANNAEWLADSGASSHMAGNAGKISNKSIYHGSDRVIIGNGQSLPITHIGQGNLVVCDSYIPLSKVLYVPQLKKNLLSVSQITTDLPYTFEFSSSSCCLKDRRTGKTVAQGSKKDGVYIIGDSNGTITDSSHFHEAFFSSRFRRVFADFGTSGLVILILASSSIFIKII